MSTKLEQTKALTPEELTVLEQFRKAQEERREKELVAAKAEYAKKVELKSKEVIKAAAQREAARNFFKGFDQSKFELVERVDLASLVVKLNGDTVYHDSKYELKKLFIQCTVPGFKHKVVSVREHVVYSGSWSSYGSNKGFKMFYDTSRAYKNAKKLSTLILNDIEKQIEAREAEVRKANSFENALQMLTEKFPNSEVKKDFISQAYGYNRRNRYFDVIRVTHPNGFGQVIKVDNSGELTVWSSFIGKISSGSVVENLELLSTINFK